MGTKKRVLVLVAIVFSLVVVVVAGCPSESQKVNDQGQIALDKKDFDLAISCFTEAIRLAPKDAVAYRNRGLAYSEKGECDKAVADCTEAIRLDPKDGEAYLYRSIAYDKKGDHSRGDADIAEAKRLGLACEKATATTHPTGNVTVKKTGSTPAN